MTRAGSSAWAADLQLVAIPAHRRTRVERSGQVDGAAELDGEARRLTEGLGVVEAVEIIRCVGGAANECRRKLARKATIFSTVDLPEALRRRSRWSLGRAPRSPATRCEAAGGVGTFAATRRSMTWAHGSNRSSRPRHGTTREALCLPITDKPFGGHFNKNSLTLPKPRVPTGLDRLPPAVPGTRPASKGGAHYCASRASIPVHISASPSEVRPLDFSRRLGHKAGVPALQPSAEAKKQAP